MSIASLSILSNHSFQKVSHIYTYKETTPFSSSTYQEAKKIKMLTILNSLQKKKRSSAPKTRKFEHSKISRPAIPKRKLAKLVLWAILLASIYLQNIYHNIWDITYCLFISNSISAENNVRRGIAYRLSRHNFLVLCVKMGMRYSDKDM